MAAEIGDFRPGGTAPAGRRCRFCARLLDQVDEPDHMRPHCDARGCSTCLECSFGVTPVSPLYVPPGATR